jgi:hypothetical protein
MLWRRAPKITVAKSKGAVIACLFLHAAKLLILHVQICVEVCSTQLECDYYGTHFGANDCFVLKDCCGGEAGTLASPLLVLCCCGRKCGCVSQLGESIFYQSGRGKGASPLH